MNRHCRIKLLNEEAAETKAVVHFGLPFTRATPCAAHGSTNGKMFDGKPSCCKTWNTHDSALMLAEALSQQNAMIATSQPDAKATI